MVNEMSNIKKTDKYGRDHTLGQTAAYAESLGLSYLAKKLSNASFETKEKPHVSATELAMLSNELEKSNPRATIELIEALTEKEELPKSQHERTAKRLAWQALHLGRPKAREQALLELQVLTRKKLLEDEEE